MTNGIVNDIKSKIQSFKNKKNSEKMMPKSNELDIEVNKDLLNQFKKTKTISSPAELSEGGLSFRKKENIEPNIPQQKKFESFKKEIDFSNSGKNTQEGDIRASTPLNNSRLMNNYFDEERSETPTLSPNKLSGNNLNMNQINSRPQRTFLRSHETSVEKERDKSNDK